EDPRGRETAHLVVRREADPELLPVPALAAFGLLATQRVIVEQRERVVEGGAVVARVDRQARGDRRRELLDEVPASQLDRVEVELAGERIHRPLDRVGG